MHLQKLYGYTYIEIKKDFGKIKIYKMFNQKRIDPMHVVLSKTIKTLDKTLRISCLSSLYLDFKSINSTLIFFYI